MKFPGRAGLNQGEVNIVTTRTKYLMLLGVLAALPTACLDPTTGEGQGEGGTSGQGGSTGSGGQTAAGGSSATGGTSSTGRDGTGGTPETGGTTTGGVTGTGGRTGTGGTTTGGATGTGGRSGTGGSRTGGTTAGGTTGTGGRMGTGGATTAGGATGTGGRTGAGGTTTTGGATGTGGRTGTGGATTTGGATGAGGATGTGGTTAPSTGLEKFSFFVTSIEAMRELSGSQDGFGGDLRFGEATGLAGADKICRTIAERSMAGSGAKGWAAFLSATTGGPNGGAVNAIDRVGQGPWYDRLGRTVALTKADLANTRPGNCATAICSDLPNENGVPNHQNVDNHDVLTGSNASGNLSSTSAGATCNDWTSAVGSTGKPMCGHSWPANSGQGWIQAHSAGGCAPGVNLAQTGGAGGTTTVGGGGGYGGIYCFALQP